MVSLFIFIKNRIREQFARLKDKVFIYLNRCISCKSKLSHKEKIKEHYDLCQVCYKESRKRMDRVFDEINANLCNPTRSQQYIKYRKGRDRNEKIIKELDLLSYIFLVVGVCFILRINS